MIKLNLLGKPNIEIEGKAVDVSLKKSEAILYYIGVQKRVTRSELVALIWSDTDEQTAKKNLRNSLYRLKKDLELDIFQCPNKNIIELDEKLVLTLDYDYDDLKFLKAYQGKFLEGFVLKESEKFEQWTVETEATLNQKFMTLGSRLIRSILEKKDQSMLDQALEIALIMKQIDEFDEQVTRFLMQLYHFQHQYKPIVEEYQRIKTLLDEEMGILPDKETRELYYELINQRVDEDTTETLFGREREEELILKQLDAFVKEKDRRGIVIMGEAGVGKSKLMEESFELSNKQSLYILKANCYQMEEEFSFKPWNEIFIQLAPIIKASSIELSQPIQQMLSRVFPSFIEKQENLRMENLETIKFDYLEKIICNLLDDIGARKKILLGFEDLQWMDQTSLKLLISIMLHCKHVTFMGTMRNEYSNKIDQFMAIMHKYSLIKDLNLDRFTQEDTYEFIDYLTDGQLDEVSKSRIYKETEGNAFFVVEYINSIDEKLNRRIKDILAARFIGISQEAMKILNITAMFFDELEFDLLLKLYAKEPYETIDHLQELKDKFILKEYEGDEDVRYRFTHHKLREYIYEAIPLPKRKILHNKIADTLEEMLVGNKKDVLIFQKLIYHYQAAGNYQKHLKYYLRYLKTYFDFSHELYPEINNQTALKLEHTPDKTFREIAFLIEQEKERNDEIDALEMEYLHMYARYLVRQGHYVTGIKMVEKLIKLAKSNHDDDMLWKAYIQWVYYCIQVEDSGTMEAVLNWLSEMDQNPKKTSILERLIGINCMMKGDYERARIHFERSIEGFEALMNTAKYALNIAAAHNYISETYRREANFEKALEYVKEAIVICESYNIFRGLSIFNTNAGMIAYNLGEKALSKQYFENAMDHFDAIDTVWRRSEAECYLAMIYWEEGENEKSMYFIEEAERHSKIINTPETIRLVNQFKIRMRSAL